MGRLLLVSNRLPVTVRLEAGRVKVTRSSGGLATGLRGPHERSGGSWIGWPGDVSKMKEEQVAEVERQLSALHCVPITLTPGEVTRYYENFSNGVLWPLFHYMTDRVPMDARDWETYRKVNEKFAQAVLQTYQPGDTIWVQDYQLCLVPALLRARLPQAKIGFFLHIPFPATDVFRILPWREPILRGLLGADLIGFHTHGYVRHFAKSVVRVLGSTFDAERVPHEGRIVKLGAHPMGVDVEAFEKLAESDVVRAHREGMQAEARGQKLLVAINRLDYTKGIKRRLAALERLLEREPSLRGNLRLVQVAVPSREKVEAYATFRHEVEALVGRINGTYGSLTSQPIHYVYRSFSEAQVAALYAAADVMLVTPLRDGMNLVAKEFLATRTDGDGVLVLSEFAGAHSELGEAVAVNPYDTEAMADAVKRALSMPEAERRARMKALRERVKRDDVHRWAARFLEELENLPAAPPSPLGEPAQVEELVRSLRDAPRLTLLLDYDGTLRPLVPTPEEAAPSEVLRALLAALTQRRNTTVHVVSGRTREALEGWLGDLSVGLAAEHGLYVRPAGGAWQQQRELHDDWKEIVRPILQAFTDRTPGARIEEKSSTFAWHYRNADEEFGPVQARELAVHLIDMLTNLPVEVMHGHKVVEVRQQGVHKGLVVDRILTDAPSPSLLAAFGDDRTDEDTFAALPEGSISVHVGTSPSRARYGLRDPAAVLAVLRKLL